MNLVNQLLNQDSGAQRGQVEISSSAAALFNSDMIQEGTEIQAGFTEVNRLGDVVEGLQNLSAINAQISKASGTDVAHSANTIAMAFAGNENGAATTMTVGLEDAVGGSIGLEGISDMVKNAWKAIKDFVIRTYKQVVKFFKSRWGAAANLRKSLDKVLERVEKARTLSKDEAKTDFGREGRLFYLGDSKNGNLETGFMRLKDIIEVFTGKASKIEAFGKEAETKIGEIDAESPSAAPFNGALNKLSGLELPKAGFAADETLVPSEIKTYVSAGTYPVLGGKELITVIPTGDNAGDNFAQVARTIRINTKSAFDKKKESEDFEGERSTLELTDIEKIADIIKDALYALDQFEDGKIFTKLSKAKDKLLTSADKLEKSLDKQEYEGDKTVAANATRKASRAACTGYTRLSTEPFITLSNLILEQGNMFVVVANKSLANYK